MEGQTNNAPANSGTLSSGRAYAHEGRLIAPVLYPDGNSHYLTVRRLRRRYRELVRSRDPREQAIGFFLFGIAEALDGSARHG